MTRPPTYPAPGVPADEEVLDELGDDAIVAQQAVHAPQPRVQVEMEARTIVVAEEPAALDPSEVMETRQLPQYGLGGDLPTMARRAASRAPTMVLRRSELALPPKKKRNWVVIGIWVAAGVAAFGFGGILAALTARGSADDSAASATPIPPPPTATPKPAVAPPPAPKPADQSEAVEAVTASELPVESGDSARSAPRRRMRPSSTAAKAGTATAPKPVAPKSDIPEGI